MSLVSEEKALSEKGIAKSGAEEYAHGMIRRMFIVVLSAAYLGLVFGGASPVIYCSVGLDICPVEVADSCRKEKARDCCSHQHAQKNEETPPSECCFAVLENGDGWVLPNGVKTPELTHFECYTMSALPFPLRAAPDWRRPCFTSPDPPGPAGRTLLIRVSRQLV